MPDISINGARLHYEIHGEGPETVFFAHGLLWSSAMFERQVDALKDRYRCVTFDFRGQGQSEMAPAGYDMDTLAEDAAALIEALDAAPCHFVGLSMGGFVGMRLAIRRPELLRSLVLLETSADPEPPESARQYRLLNFVARWFGLGLVAGRVMPIMFGAPFLTDPERADLRTAWRERLVANHKVGITRAVKGVVERDGVYDQLDQITVPTLVVVGEEDAATPPPKAERIAARIPDAELVVLPRAGHTSTVEEPEAVNAALESFLKTPREASG